MSRRDDIKELRRTTPQSGLVELRSADAGAGDTEAFRLVRGLVKEPSGVTAGATFTIDNIEPLAGGLDPSGGSASFELEVNTAKKSYADNDEVIAIHDPAATDDWIDATDLNDGAPPTYNCQLYNNVKARTDASVSVKLLDDSLSEIGDAVTAHDPHGEFSGGDNQDAKGRLTLVTDADTDTTRYEFTHLEGPALFIKGTFAHDADYISSGVTDASSITYWGPKWQRDNPIVSPTTVVYIVGLAGSELTGESFKAVLKNPDATPLEYELVGGGGASGNGKIGKTNTTITAASDGNVTSGEVSVYEINTTTLALTDTTVDETWYNMAGGDDIPSGTWVQAKPVPSTAGATVYVIDWQECP